MSIRDPRRFDHAPLRVLCLAFLAFVALPSHRASAAAVVASVASDLCADGVDPCVVAQPVSVAGGSRLDFGLRTLRIEGQGSVEFGDGDLEVACGRLDLASGAAAFRARGSVLQGAGLRIEVRRSCVGAASRPCFVDADCGAGSAALCSGGSGQASIGAAIIASGESPGRVVVRSAGDLEVHATLTVAGTRRTSDGGDLELESTQGSAAISAPVDVSGGAAAAGGNFSVTAAGDITIDAGVDANGGDYDGGTIALAAGRDARIQGDLSADAAGGSGSGGEIDAEAARDIVVGDPRATGSVVLSSDGHQSSDNVGGDGGSLAFDAGRDIVVSRDVRIVANGAPPDGFADTVSFDAGRDVTLEGDLVAKARGSFGGGGHVDIVADAAVRLAATASVDLSGNAAGGDCIVECGGALASAATLDVSGGASGVGGRVVATAAADVDVSGSWSTTGAPSLFSSGDFFVEGCHVRVSGRLDNSADAGRNRIVAHESFAVADGGEVLASGRGATNVFLYRSALKPPSVVGVVAPPASLVVDDDLAGCAVCGNGEVDAGESCDDGNAAAGDGCSPRCQDEGCEAGTIGAADSALCSDANECTDDGCDTGLHRCVHSTATCNDGVACTADSCAGSVCIHDARQQLCDDGNACTTDECSREKGCVHAPAVLACDDGVFCNGADACADGACSRHDGDPCAAGGDCRNLCDEAATSCLVPAGRSCVDDANACTDDVCDGNGICMHPANRRPCDDGSFCDGVDACAGASCSVHSGNPCGLDHGCAEVCDDAAASCETAPPCDDDGNPCTADFCDAGGGCVHLPVDAACDDGDFCSVGDACSAGSCSLPPLPTLAVASFKVRVGRGSGRGRADWKLEFPARFLPEAPDQANLRVVVAAAPSIPVFDATLPAGSLQRTHGVWRFQATRGAGAHGVAGCSFSLARDASVVRARIRLAAANLADLASSADLSLALLFGDEPGLGACSSSGPMVCEHDAKGVDCTSPP